MVAESCRKASLQTSSLRRWILQNWEWSSRFSGLSRKSQTVSGSCSCQVGGSPPVYTRFVSEKARWRLWPLPFCVPPGDYYERSYDQVFCVAEGLSPDLHPYGSLYVTMTGGLCTVPSADILGASRLVRRDQGLPEKGVYYERQWPQTLFPLATPKPGVDDARTVIRWCEERIRKLDAVAEILEEFRWRLI